MNPGKKKRSGNLLVSATALIAVLAASVWRPVAFVHSVFDPPLAAEVLARIQSQPQAAEAMLDQLPCNRQSLNLLVQLLAASDQRTAQAARRSILMRLDESLANRAMSRHDELAVGVAAALESQAQPVTLPLGATDDLVTHLLRCPPVGEQQRAEVAARCTRALKITADKQQRK